MSYLRIAAALVAFGCGFTFTSAHVLFPTHTLATRVLIVCIALLATGFYVFTE